MATFTTMFHSPLLVLIIFLIVSCQPPKSQSVDLHTLDIGIDQTVIYGTIEVLDKSKNLLTISVKQSRQGGSTAPAVALNTTLDAVADVIFQRVFESKTGLPLMDQVEEGQQVIVFITKSMRDTYFSIEHLEIKSP